MNEKIYTLIRNSGAITKKDYKAFVDDEYGSWQNVGKGANGAWAIGEGCIWGHHTYNGNGANYRGNPVAQRTIANMCKAYEINFETWYAREVNNVWSWRNYDFFVKVADKILITKDGVSVNGTTLCAFSEYDHHNITLRQNKLIMDNVPYMYPDGFKMADANNDIFYTEINNIDVNAGGYACTGRVYLYLANLNIKHIK